MIALLTLPRGRPSEAAHDDEGPEAYGIIIRLPVPSQAGEQKPARLIRRPLALV